MFLSYVLKYYYNVDKPFMTFHFYLKVLLVPLSVLDLVPAVVRLKNRSVGRSLTQHICSLWAVTFKSLKLFSCSYAMCAVKLMEFVSPLLSSWTAMATTCLLAFPA